MAGLATYFIVANAVKGPTAEADLPEDGHLDLPEVTAPVGPNEEYTPSVPEGGVGEVNPPGPDVTPEPGATPDITQSWWYVPYLNAERDKPTTVQTINGITVGPGRLGVREADREECASEPRSGRYDDVADEEMAIDLDVLPPDAEPISDGGDWGAVFCEDRALTVGVEVAIPPDKHGAILGGSVIITKYRGAAVSAIDIPDHRWRPGEINGYPAAIADPILPDIGLGQSAVIVYYQGILLRVQASDLPADMLLEIAEAQLP